MKKILIGTHNPGKLKEYRFLLKEIKAELVSLDDLDIKKDVAEDGKTYRENAVKKALSYSGLTGLPVLADDGGLEIDALDGEPGLKSRRWPGYEAEDEELIEFALERLKNVPREKRTARLAVVVGLAFPGNKVFTARGEKQGLILERARGKLIPGYPFRSLLYLPEMDKTFNQLSFKEEAEVGHRKKALAELKPVLRSHGF